VRSATARRLSFAGALLIKGRGLSRASSSGARRLDLPVEEPEQGFWVTTTSRRSGYGVCVPVDPAPSLSTVILASAALVAIVGGLLVARLVGLDSEQQTSSKLLADASDRLAIARRRADTAREDLIRWRAQDFLDEEDVADAIAGGQTDADELRKLASTRLTHDELRIVISQAAADISAVGGWLSSDTVCEDICRAEYRWRDFSRDEMPPLNYPQLARRVFEIFAAKLAYDDEQKRRKEEARRQEEERQRANSPESQMLGLAAGSFKIGEAFGALGLGGSAPSKFNPPDLNALSRVAVRPVSTQLIDANRHDDLVASHVRATQRVEDLEEELRRLRRQHADVVKPDARLWWAVAILTAYAVAGVAVPLWVMSSGPASLSAVRWTLWPFAAGLAALIAYIAWYLFGLTRRRRQWAITDVDGVPDSPTAR